MALDRLIKNIGHLDMNEAFYQAFSYDHVQTWIVDKIQDRLGDTGLTSSLTKLQTNRSFSRKKTNTVYSAVTERIKKQKGQQYNWVTLKDTGEFYKTFRIIVSKKNFSIYGDTQKEDGLVSDNFLTLFRGHEKFVSEVFALTKNETNELLYYIIKPMIINNIKKQLLKK